MIKKDLRTWEAIVAHAQERAKNSLVRNDPIAFAYWRETQVFAEESAFTYRNPGSWQRGAVECVERAKAFLQVKDYMGSALWYSRAKWFVIIARANGMVMDPKKTGVNLKWLAAEKGVKRAFPRLVAAAH